MYDIEYVLSTRLVNMCSTEIHPQTETHLSSKREITDEEIVKHSERAVGARLPTHK